MQMEKQQSSSSVKNVVTHMKIYYGNEIRRFSLGKGSFSYVALLEYVRKFFGIHENENIVVKYQDDENDLITISSDEELEFAVGLFKDTVMKLRVEKLAQPQTQAAPQSQCDNWSNWRKMKAEKKAQRCGKWRNDCGPENQNQGSRCGKWRNDCGLDNQNQCDNWSNWRKMKAEKKAQRCGKWRNDCGQENQNQGSRCGKWRNNPEFLNCKIQKLTAKRAHLQEKLDKLKAAKEASPNDYHCEGKENRLTNCLQGLDAKIGRLNQLVANNATNVSAAPSNEIKIPVDACDNKPTCENPKSWKEQKMMNGGECRGRGAGRGCGKKWDNPKFQQIKAKRQEIKQLRRSIHEEGVQDKEAAFQRIAALKQEIQQLRTEMC
jgi:hypothetical protein